MVLDSERVMEGMSRVYGCCVKESGMEVSIECVKGARKEEESQNNST
jgi:hypothetical protein